MNYPETLDYLYAQLPMFTRVGSSAFKADLNNTLALCGLLGNPQNKFKSIHVGGTNGKGSTSHMLAAILQTAGYKTGLYTSPHLKDFRERIRINGAMISQQDVIDFVAAYKADFEAIKPSFFEMTVGLAFDLFARECVDIAVIEVGLGGRLDSTNVITPLLSVITNIGWDHMNILGDTLQLIAGEKAGIIKPGIPVIIGERQPEVEEIFITKAKNENAALLFASDAYRVNETEGDGNFLNIEFKEKAPISNRGSQILNLDLTGTYQLKNIKTVLAAVYQLRRQGFVITDAHVKTALANVKILTGLHGRWETISNAPLTICDTGHNPEGVQEVLHNIARVKFNRLHFVIGMVNDKDLSKVLAMLPKNAVYYFCRPDIPRGLDAESLKEQAIAFGLKGQTYTSVPEALHAAQASATTADLVFVGGSTFVVAEAI